MGVGRRGGEEGEGPEGEKVEGNVWSAASVNVGCSDGGSGRADEVVVIVEE